MPESVAAFYRMPIIIVSYTFRYIFFAAFLSENGAEINSLFAFFY